MAAPEFFSWGALRGQKALLRGQKPKNLPKMVDFCLFVGGGGKGAEPPTGENVHSCSPLMPPLHDMSGKRKQFEEGGFSSQKGRFYFHLAYKIR